VARFIDIYEAIRRRPGASATVIFALAAIPLGAIMQ